MLAQGVEFDEENGREAGVRLWLLDDSAEPGAISVAITAEAVRLVLAGRGILILARRLEPEVDVRTGLLQALDLFTAPMEEGGRA